MYAEYKELRAKDYSPKEAISAIRRKRKQAVIDRLRGWVVPSTDFNGTIGGLQFEIKYLPEEGIDYFEGTGELVKIDYLELRAGVHIEIRGATRREYNAFKLDYTKQNYYNEHKAKHGHARALDLAQAYYDRMDTWVNQVVSGALSNWYATITCEGETEYTYSTDDPIDLAQEVCGVVESFFERRSNNLMDAA